MNEDDFRTAADLARLPESYGHGIARAYSHSMLRLVRRLQSLPMWERISPTPEIAEREWNKIRTERNARDRQRRKAHRQQRTFPYV